MRRIVRFRSEGHALFGTLDEADGPAGVLIVSGGNEPRVGAHRGMAMLAARLAARGIPVFRFDRRGIGDSDGKNGGYAASEPDIFNAALVFGNMMPAMTRIVGLGNCDAATALALFGRSAGVEAVILTNPWLGDTGPLPPPAAVRARYWARLRDPRTWRQGFDIRKLVNGLRSLSAKSCELPLAERMAAGLTNLPTTIVLAERDRTAQVFAAGWRSPGRIVTLPTASHSFADAGDALEAAIVAAIGG